MKANKINVVCDTNIWYLIAEGRILPGDYKEFNLIGTYVNAMELATSQAMIKKPEIWNKAVDVFFLLNHKLKTLDHFNYIKKESGIYYNNRTEKEILITLRKIRDYSNKNDPEIRSIIYGIINEQSGEVNDLMNQIEDIRTSLYNEKGGYNNYINSISTPEKRMEQLEIAKEHISSLTKIDKINWENFALYRDTFEEWFYQLVKVRNLKINNNDWNDLVNLSYVKPDEYYWTKDKKRQENILKIVEMKNISFISTFRTA